MNIAMDKAASESSRKSSAASPEVAIIVVNYNGWADTIECLESLLRMDYANFRIFVVDNGSTNGSVEYLQAWAEGRLDVFVPENHPLKHLSFPPVKKPLSFFKIPDREIEQVKKLKNVALTLIISATNRGFAGGNNLGLRLAMQQPEFRYFWLLNNDTVVEPGALQHMISCARNSPSPKIGLWGNKLLLYNHPDIIQAIGGRYHPCLANVSHVGSLEVDRGQYDMDLPDVDYPIGASLFIDRKFLEEVGFMCEDYFLFFEELDWVLRARQKGWSFGYCWKAKVYHKEGATIGATINRVCRDEQTDLYWLKNRLLITRKFYPHCLWMVYLSFVGVIFNRILRGQWSRIPKIIKLLRTP